MDSEDLLYLLYTSGTTGKPKGIVHTTAGYLVGVSTTHQLVFDIKPDSVYWCAADIGWVTGHSYIVYGPLCNGVHEGPLRGRRPTIRQPSGGGRSSSATASLSSTPRRRRSEAHMKWGPEHARKHDLSSIRLLGHRRRADQPGGRGSGTATRRRRTVPVVDTWWQTETGMIMITPLPA